MTNEVLEKIEEYLDMVEEMRGLPHRRCGTSAEMERRDTDFKIELNREKKR